MIVAAGLPLVVAMLAVLGTFVVLTLLAKFTDVSVFSLNLATGLGLGLAIDYSLFVVSRYREELARGVSPPVAVGPVDADGGPHRRVQRGHRRDLADVARDLPGRRTCDRSRTRASRSSRLAAVASVVVLPGGARGRSARASRSSGCSRCSEVDRAAACGAARPSG